MLKNKYSSEVSVNGDMEFAMMKMVGDGNEKC